jgi:hypothetical protein
MLFADEAAALENPGLFFLQFGGRLTTEDHLGFPGTK